MTLAQALATGKDAVNHKDDQAARVFVNARNQYEVIIAPHPDQEALYNWCCAATGEAQAIVRQHAPRLSPDEWTN